MPKKLLITLFCGILVPLLVYPKSSPPEVLNLKGFYLGMDKSEVQEIYQKYKTAETAKYISIDSSQYRDLIQLDNEFSSMGNKIEITYENNAKVTSIKFQYKTSAILFKYDTDDPEVFVQKFTEEFNIPEMQFEDMGMVKTWTYKNESSKYSVSIDDYLNITFTKLE